MAEVIGLLASIGQLAEYILKACDCIDRIRHATSEKAAISREISLLFTLLTRLGQKINLSTKGGETHAEWLTHVLQLRPSLIEMYGDLQDLVTRTSRNRFLWPWDERKCQRILERIERLKSTIQMGMQESLIDMASEKLNAVASDVRALRESQESVWWDRVRQWFPSADSRRTQQAVFDKSHPGTGNWLLQHATFISWKEDEGATLWCYGIPGAGKTVMASIIVNHLVEIHKADAGVVTLCIYFDYREAQDHIEILNNVYTQLLCRHESVPEQTKFLIEKWQRLDGRPTVSGLKDLIRSELSACSNVYLIIDAFDECTKSTERDKSEKRHDQFRHAVYESLRSLNPHLHVLVTSRALGELQSLFEGCTQLEIEAHEGDVRAYVEQQILDSGPEYKWTKMCSGDALFQTTVINTIIERAQKMFLLVRLHVDTLNTQNKVKDVQRALSCLPTRLYDTYDNAMTRIRAQSEAQRRRAEKVLMWITYALRPLTVSELQHAEAVSSGDFELDERDIEHFNDLISCCAGLVTTDPTTQVVRFVHYTTQEYFQSYRSKHFPGGHSDITKICLTYLQLDTLEDCKTWHRDQIYQKFPFVGYSACHWGLHATENLSQDLLITTPLDDKKTFDLAIGLLEQETRVSDEFYSLPREEDLESIALPQHPHPHWSLGKRRLEWQVSTRPHGLHIAAGFGLNSILKAFLNTGTDPNLRDGRGYTPLHRAVLNGKYEAARILIERGANVDLQSTCYSISPLTCAAATGRAEIAQLLLERGADVNAECTGALAHSTALFEACWIGDTDTVKLLLGYGAECRMKPDKTTEFFNGRWPMIAAVGFGGGKKVVELLIASGVDLEGLGGYLALQEALRVRVLSTVQLLLDKGADISFAPDGQRTIMQIAYGTGSWAIVRYLVQRQLSTKNMETYTESLVATKFTELPWFSNTLAIHDQEFSPYKKTDASTAVLTFRRGDQCDYDVLSDPAIYMGFFVPPHVTHVRRIIFRVNSHDQGQLHYLDSDHRMQSYGQDNSSDTGNHTFFEASIQSRLGEERYLERPIFYNERQNAKWQLKTCVWNRNDEDKSVADCLKDIGPGHIIQVRPKARRPGWVNYVSSCEVEIHYGSTRCAEQTKTEAKSWALEPPRRE